jgi:hypothetical protein
MALADLGEEGRRKPIAARRQRTARLMQDRALCDTAVDQCLDLVELGLAVDRAHVGVLVQRVAQTQQLDPPRQLRHQRAVDALLHQEPRPGTAHMSLVEEDAAHDPFDRLVEGCVLEHDVRGLAAELERERCAAASQPLLDLLAHRGAAGECDLVQILVLDQQRPGRAVAGDDIDHALGQPGLGADLGQPERGERAGLCRLEHDRVAAGQCRGQLPRRDQQREVPRDHGAHHAERLGSRAGEGQVELVRPARMVEEVRRRQRHVDIAGLADRLAAVHGLEAGQLARALLDDARDAVEVARAIGARHRSPHVVECAPRRGHRAVDVGRRGVADLAEHLLGGGVHRRQRPAIRGWSELAVDVEPVARGDLEVVGRFGGRRVPPGLQPQLRPCRWALGAGGAAAFGVAHASLARCHAQSPPKSWGRW